MKMYADSESSACRLAGQPEAPADVRPDVARTRLAATLPSYGEPLKAMTGKYRARNPALVTALTLLDLLGKLHPRRDGRLPTDRPIRILIANWAHLGDVVAMLPLLQFLADHPRIGGIGVLVGTWSKGIVSGLPFVERIHCLDHFLLDREPASRGKKIRRYSVRQREVVTELRNSRYDVSIDLFSVFPPTHRLMWKARIPTRIGFSSTGLGTYLTHPYSWPTEDEYILTKQLRLLEPVFGNETPKTLPAAYPHLVRSEFLSLPFNNGSRIHFDAYWLRRFSQLAPSKLAGPRARAAKARQRHCVHRCKRT